MQHIIHHNCLIYILYIYIWAFFHSPIIHYVTDNHPSTYVHYYRGQCGNKRQITGPKRQITGTKRQASMVRPEQLERAQQQERIELTRQLVVLPLQEEQTDSEGDASVIPPAVRAGRKVSGTAITGKPDSEATRRQQPQTPPELLAGRDASRETRDRSDHGNQETEDGNQETDHGNQETDHERQITGRTKRQIMGNKRQITGPKRQITGTKRQITGTKRQIKRQITGTKR
eukprot:113945_1